MSSAFDTKADQAAQQMMEAVRSSVHRAESTIVAIDQSVAELLELIAPTSHERSRLKQLALELGLHRLEYYLTQSSAELSPPEAERATLDIE